MDSAKFNRRNFVQLIGLGALAGTLLPLNALAQERRRGGAAKPAGELDLPLAVPGKDAAAALNYVEKHSDVKKAELKVAKSGVAFEQQKCSNCMFYKKVGTKNGKEVGTCQVLPGKLVLADAWSTSWTKKV